MKTRFTLLGVVAMLIISICAIFVSCNKDLNDIVKYYGEVIYINTTNPFPNLTVKVTNGTDTHCQAQTDEAGQFLLNVRVNEIDGSYYLLAGDSTCIPKKVALGGYGQKEVDLGVIEVEGPSLPVVVTHVISSVTADEAVCGGEVTSDGRLKVTARGICYGKEVYPETSGVHTKDGEGVGEFTSTLKDLEHNTIYYARAYATNSIGTAYGEQVKFTTEEGVAVVVTDTIDRIEATSARCKGHVVSDGGFVVTKRGVCWSTYPDPTIADDHADEGSGVGEFAISLNNLEKDTKYYVRTYAINQTATVYGEQKSFSTLDGLASVDIISVSSLITSLTIKCEVTNDGGYNVSERGICYSNINSEPSVDDGKVANGRGKGQFSVSVSNLDVATTYYVRAYAENENGIAYGQVKEVSTSDGIATVIIDTITDKTAMTASCKVTVTNAGGADLQTCGICWSTTPNPTIESNTDAGGSVLNTIYTCRMTDLAPATTYYVRGFATTNITTTYSQQTSFTTETGLPLVVTDSITANSVSITGYGNVKNDAGYSITARGLCYSTSNSSPTIADSHTTSGIGIGTFSSIITNVSLSTTYYVRAYATNSIGTAYGSVTIVTTGDGLPSVTTTVIGENVTENTASSGGQVTSDGGYTVTGRGVCWSSLPYPTINDNKTTDGSGLGYFSSNITGIDITGSNTYYVRAYATNANGTSYGEQVLISKENMEYKNLPAIKYGGYIYRLYPDIGVMTWDAANATCENLVYGGYDDWTLPETKDLLRHIMTVHQEGWYCTDGSEWTEYTSAYYWTSEKADSSSYWVVRCSSVSSSGVSDNYYLYSRSCRVRPMRKYLTNQ